MRMFRCIFKPNLVKLKSIHLKISSNIVLMLKFLLISTLFEISSMLKIIYTHFFIYFRFWLEWERAYAWLLVFFLVFDNDSRLKPVLINMERVVSSPI